MNCSFYKNCSKYNLKKKKKRILKNCCLIKISETTNCFRAFMVWVKFIKLMEVLFQNMQMSRMEDTRNKCIRESRIFALLKL